MKLILTVREALLHLGHSKLMAAAADRRHQRTMPVAILWNFTS